MSVLILKCNGDSNNKKKNNSTKAPLKRKKIRERRGMRISIDINENAEETQNKCRLMAVSHGDGGTRHLLLLHLLRRLLFQRGPLLIGDLTSTLGWHYSSNRGPLPPPPTPLFRLFRVSFLFDVISRYLLCIDSFYIYKRTIFRSKGFLFFFSRPALFFRSFFHLSIYFLNPPNREIR